MISLLWTTVSVKVRHDGPMRLLPVLALAAVLVPAAFAGGARPHLKVTSLAPARVAGSGFQARERVVVTVSGTATHLKRAVLTSAAGTFVARFTAGVSAPGCHQVAVVALGARGDRAAWKSPQRPCGPPPAP